MPNYVSVFIDFKGKQNYIFSSNVLKLQIGASNIMQDLALGSIIFDLLKHLFHKDGTDVNSDWSSFEEPFINKYGYHIGYLGGGNGLLLFNLKDIANEFVLAYRQKLNIDFPDLEHVISISEKFDPEKWQDSNSSIRAAALLEESKRFNTKPQLHPLAQKCQYYNYPAIEEHENFGWVSKAALSKFNAVDKHKYKLLRGSKFLLTDKHDELNNNDTRAYLALVHIDGNELGKQFMDVVTLKGLKDLSLKTNASLNKAMEAMLAYLCSEFDTRESLIFKDIVLKEVIKDKIIKRILPFRPIINAGDDITFICHGDLGVYLAIKYMELLKTEGIDTCAGVMIFKKHQPISMAYELAETLAGRAKVASRKDAGNWISFAVCQKALSSNFLDTLKNKNGQQISGLAYKLGDSFQSLLNQIQKTNDFPENALQTIKEGILNPEQQNRKRIDLLGQVKFTKDRLDNIFEEFTYDALELRDIYPLPIENVHS